MEGAEYKDIYNDTLGISESDVMLEFDVKVLRQWQFGLNKQVVSLTSNLEKEALVKDFSKKEWVVRAKSRRELTQLLADLVANRIAEVETKEKSKEVLLIEFLRERVGERRFKKIEARVDAILKDK